MSKYISFRHPHFLLLISFLLLIADILQSTIWTTQHTETHLLLEAFCILMSAMIFVLIWFSYEKAPDSYRILGFSSLIICLLYAAHLHFYPSYSGAADNLSIYFVMTARIIEALAFFSITLNISLRSNKWIALILSLSMGAAIITSIVSFADTLPVLYDASGYTGTKIGLEVVILLILVINIYFLNEKRNTKDIFPYNLILAALLINVFLTTFFLFQKGPDTTWSLLGHLLRITFYFHFFKVIFTSTISYPYKKLEEVLNHLPLAVVTYDHAQRLTCANKMAEEITGLNFAQVKGFTQSELVDKMYNNQASREVKNDLELRNDALQKIITIKNQQNGLVKIVVDAYKLQSGGYLCVFDTANKAQEIQNLRLQTQIILNSLNNYILITDMNQNVTMCNKTLYEAAKLSPQEIIGRNLSELLLNSKLTPDQLCSISPHQVTPDKPMEVSFTTVNGENKDLLLQKTLIKNIEGEVIGNICMGSDITILKKEQAESREKEKLALLGQMATGIVHEIRNPITAMMGFIQLLNIKLQDEKLREYCSHIANEAADLNRIVSDFLQFARPPAPIFKSVGPNYIVETLKHIIDTHLFPDEIKIRYTLQPNIPPIEADESKIKQVILNIVKNAVDAVKDTENPEIIIKTGYNPANHETYISITNNGIAITPEEKQMICTPFYTTKTKGTGLGLSICNRIISEHKGKINITSDTMSGTTFKLIFPALKAVEYSEVI